jgi:hypothetical protein
VAATDIPAEPRGGDCPKLSPARDLAAAARRALSLEPRRSIDQRAQDQDDEHPSLTSIRRACSHCHQKWMYQRPIGSGQGSSYQASWRTTASVRARARPGRHRKLGTPQADYGAR